MSKKDALKLPRRVAGVKVPKRLRKGANRFMGSAAGQLVVAEVFAAAAAALIAHESQPGSPSRKLSRRSASALGAAKDRILTAAEALKGEAAATAPALHQAVRAASDSFSRTLQQRRSFGSEDETSSAGDMTTTSGRSSAATGDLRPQA